MRVLVVHGGDGLSDEAEVSHKTGAMILAALRTLPWVDVEEYSLSSQNLGDLPARMTDFDLVWPALHGKIGEDGEIQKMCEDNSIKFVGSGSIASKLCFDKDLYKQKLIEWGIKTPGSQIIRHGDICSLSFPICLKPIASGSSVDTFKIESYIDLQEKLFVLSAKYSEMLIEEWIEGRECTFGVLGEEALPAIEIIPPESADFFDLESKYDGSSKEICPPINIDQATQDRGCELALLLHLQTGCRHMSRTDMILRDGDLYVLETNTLPGMTSESLFPKAARVAGYDFNQLIGRILELATT